jgi:hypothetical protein
MTTVSTVKNITVAYNPNDFYYMNAINSADEPANTAPIGGSSTHENYCNTKRTATCANDGYACKYDKALCINEDNQKKINNLQLKHDGADERHGDINIYYNRELLKSYNLGIGIIGVCIIIYFFYK